MLSFKRNSIRLSRLVSSLSVGIILLFPLKLLAEELLGEELLGEELPAEKEPQPIRIRAIDTPRDYLSGKFVTFVSGIDRFFGDDRNYEESNKSVVQLDLTRVSGYGGDRKLVLSGRAKVRLPSTEKRLHLILETNADKNISGDQAQDQTTPIQDVNTPESYAAGLRFEKARKSLWHFSTDAGVQFRGINTNPFARARASYAIPLDQWRLKFVETIFWFNTIDAGESTQLDVERFLSDSILFRSTSNATWLKDKQNFNLRQDLSFYHTLSERTGLLYQASAFGVSQPHRQVSDYVLLMTYRYRLHRKWIFFELSPQLHFPVGRNYQSTHSLIMRLEMLFNESR